MSSASEETSDDSILYELLVYSEWKQDPELLKYSRPGDTHLFAGGAHKIPAKHIWQFFSNRESVCDEIQRLLLRQLPWHFAVGEGGKVVAILQDTVLEIRTSRDEYSSVVGMATIPKDANPQLRKLAWSPDCSMLAVAHSNGVVSFYDLLGSNISNIYPFGASYVQMHLMVQGILRFHDGDYENAVFWDVRLHSLVDTNQHFAQIYLPNMTSHPRTKSAEIILIDYQGNLRCYLVSPTDDCQPNHVFSFMQHYRHGVLAVSYHQSHNMLFVAGPTIMKNTEKLKGHGSSFGLSAWRLLNDHPYYRLALSADEEQAVWQAKHSWWTWVPSLTSNPKQSVVFKMQVSPAGRFLACLHSCGSISIWCLPGIRLYKYWTLLDQPHYNVQNPQCPKQSCGRSSENSSFHPVDINWWTDHVVIIARYSGAVSVCSLANLRNLLGESPEFLAGPPRISSLCSDHGFLGLECESKLTSKKFPWDGHSTQSEMDSTGEEDDSDEYEESSVLNRSSALIQSAVYMVTDMEYFQPKRKRPKLCHRTYRLLGLKSTTPEELYARKIDNEEYGEALALAQAYNLDCDLVYQQQWRNNKASIATIRAYLSKVTKQVWVLKECVERVPETYAAARELLQFGLQGTDIETFISVADGGDVGNSVQHSQDLAADAEVFSSDAEEKRRKFLHSKVAVAELSGEQLQLLKYRQQLLKYFDRLCTYELIMGGPNMAEDLYDYTFYDKFRTVSLIMSTVKFARERKHKAVEIMFTYHGDAVLPHWLPVLSNFPESMDPYEYKSLLPKCDASGNIFAWSQIQLREQDWCEGTNFQNESDDCDAGFIYEEDQTLKYFACSKEAITAKLLTSWYTGRAYQIENRSCMVDHAVTLVKLARERNVIGLDHLYHQLLTLYTLVYELYLEDARLSDLQKMSDFDMCKLLMSKSVETTFIDDLKRFLLPFLLRCEQEAAGSRKQLLHDYLIHLSSQDLSLPHKLFEHLRDEQSCKLVPSLEEKMSLALDCLYAYPEADQLSKAFHILECIPGRGFSLQDPAVAALYDKLDDLQCDLRAAEVLDHNAVSKPLSFIRDNKSDPVVIQKLMVRLARTVSKKVPPPSEMDWRQLLADMLDLQANCFTNINIESCFQIYVATLLASGRKRNIVEAGNILQCHNTGWTDGNVSYLQSVQLVLHAAMEYFDSAASASDPILDLAKMCLNLITDENEEIEELLDLIAALQLLSDFGVNMLPVQVRVCSERLKLLEMCIHSKPMAYRNTQRLLQLAHKLRVCGKDERLQEGQVLVHIAEAALKAHDYQFCAEICQQLVSKSHTIGWQVVQDLGQCHEFSNLRLRCDLLAFALLYCPVDVIEVVVNTRSSLQVQLLNDMIYKQMKDDTSAEEEEFCDALTSPVSPSREFAGPVHVVEEWTQTTKNATYRLLNNIGNKSFWKTTFSWMQRNMSDAEIMERNCLIMSQGFPAFYSSLAPGCHISSFSTQYDRFSDPDICNPIVLLSQALLRTILLQGTASAGTFIDCTNVLLQLAEQFLVEDSSLGLGHILPLQDLTLSDGCFNNMPCTSIVLQLAVYYCAIQGYKQLRSTAEEDRTRERNVYLFTPSELVEHMTGLASKHEVEAWAQLLLKYQNMLVDFQQGQQLQGLECGVDLQRFAYDTQYQQDSILGLAMTVDIEKFFFAVRLASWHGVPLGEVAARHLTALVLGSEDIELSELMAHLANPQLSELLKTSPHFVCDRLVQYAFPSIEGSDHQLLLLYYTVLQSIAEDYITYSLAPKEHIKLLRKVKATSPNIDYKKMVDPSNSLMEVLLPALERNNIGLIVKLLKSMPASIQCMIQTGELYAAWAQKEFFKIPNTCDPPSTKDWLQQYKVCAEYFNKMAAAHVVDFVKGTCFSECGVDIIPSECRTAIVTQAKEYCQLKVIHPADDGGDEWTEAVKTLTHWLAHLEVVRSLEALEFCRSLNQQSHHLLRLFDVSIGEARHVQELLQSAVTSDIPLDSLKILISLVPTSAKTLEDCLDNLLKEAIEKIKCGTELEGSQLLSAVLRRMQDNLQCGASAVPQEVETLCGDASLTPEIRLRALELLQSLKPHESKSDTVLLYHHVQATIASAWPQPPIKLQETDLKTPESRMRLFSNLLNHAHTWQQIVILKDLLKKWPLFQDSSFSDEPTNPWIQLIHRMLTFEDRKMDDVENALEDILQHNNLSPTSIQQLVSMTEGTTDLPLLLMLCLLPNHSSLHTTATSLIQKYLHADSPRLSDRLLSILLQKGLAPALITTPAYSQMIEHMLTETAYDLPSWNTVANQLVAAGNIAEAGTTMLLHMGVSPALAVFSAALALAKGTSPEE